MDGRLCVLDFRAMAMVRVCRMVITVGAMVGVGGNVERCMMCQLRVRLWRWRSRGDHKLSWFGVMVDGIEGIG